MSLRVIHIVFITLSSMLAILGGVWALNQHKPVAVALASFACSAALDVYLAWFIRKSQSLKP